MAKTQIPAGYIAANAITATEIAANSITAAAIASDAIVVADIADNSITSAKIAADAVGSSELAATALSGHDTDDLSEGSTNQYHTTERVQDVVGAQLVTNGSHTGISFAYDDATDGAIDATVSLASFSTTNLSEGTNQYHTTERVQDVVGGQLVTNGSHTNITATYDDAGDGAIDLSISDATIRGKVSATDAGGDGSFSYNSTSGAFTYTGPSASETRAHFSAGTGVTLSSGEISIGQAVSTSSNVTFGNLTLSGNLTVQGTTTTLETATLNVEDKNITINYSTGDSSGSADGAGITIQDAVNSTTDATILWDATNDEFDFSHLIDATAGIKSDIFKGRTYPNNSFIDFDDDQTLANNMTTLAGIGDINIIIDSNNSSSDGEFRVWKDFVDVDSAIELFTITEGGDVDIPAGNLTLSGTVDGRDIASDGSKLDGIESGATADQTAAEILTAIKTVDGAGSGLDADLLDGQSSAYYQPASSALTTSTSFGGDVSGTYNAIVIANDSHTHAFNNLTGKTSGTGDYSTDGDLVAGRGSGSIALTINDGKGNSNVTFNHQNGVPDQNGNAARIEVNTDSTTNASMNFEVGSGVTGGTSTNLTTVLNLAEGVATVTGNIAVSGTVDGRDIASDGSKLDGIESGATADQSASEILTLIKTVDGAGSGLDADLLDGISSGSFLRSDASDTFTTLSGTQLNIGSQVQLTESSDRSDLLMIKSATSSWGGLQISNTSNEFIASFMGDGSTIGVYDDQLGDWLWQSTENGGFRAYYNGSVKMETVTGGVDITGNLTATGNVTAYSSDERLKTNITPIENPIEKVKQLNGVEFDWKENVEELGFTPRLKHETGVIAQNVQSVIPDATPNAPFNEEYLTVQHEKIIPVLIEAIKEQQKQIEELKERLNK